MHASISLEPFIYYEILCHTQFKLLFFLMLLNIMWRRQSKTRKSGSGGASSHPPSPLKLIIQMAQRKRCEKKKSRRKLVQATLRTMISCRPLTWTLDEKKEVGKSLQYLTNSKNKLLGTDWKREFSYQCAHRNWANNLNMQFLENANGSSRINGLYHAWLNNKVFLFLLHCGPIMTLHLYCSLYT